MMVNGLHLYSAFIQGALQRTSHSPIHTAMAEETMQGTTSGAVRGSVSTL